MAKQGLIKFCDSLTSVECMLAQRKFTEVMHLHFEVNFFYLIDFFYVYISIISYDS